MDKDKYFDYFLIQQTELKSGRFVYLNVYHISKINYMLKFLGLGLFHTTIEIEDIEYSFGSTQDDFSGIYINKKNQIFNNLVLKGIKIFLVFSTLSCWNNLKKVLI